MVTTRKKSGSVPRRSSPRRKKKAKARSVGRPTKYVKKYCKDLIEHMRNGGSVQGFGGLLYEKYGPKRGASEQTIYTWFKTHPEFLESQKIGLGLARKFYDELTSRGVAGALRRVTKEEYDAEGNIKKREFSAATFGQSFAIFTYKNRFGWKDRVEHSGAIVTSDKTTGKTLDGFLNDPKTAAAALQIAEAMVGDYSGDEPEDE